MLLEERDITSSAHMLSELVAGLPSHFSSSEGRSRYDSRSLQLTEFFESEDAAADSELGKSRHRAG
jgi:hypothetical protein